MNRALNQFPEYVLPKGQPIIITEAIREIIAYINILKSLKSERGVARLGAVTGDQGGGKTVAAFYEVYKSKILPHTLLPTSLFFETDSGATPKSVSDKISRFFGDEPGSLSHFEQKQPIFEKLTDNSISLIIFDEGNRSSDALFDKFREFVDYSPAAILLLGIPRLREKILSDPQLKSRVYRPHEVKPLSNDELLDVYLPKLRIPRWSFDPKIKQDRELGAWIWELVKPNLRQLQDTLQDASEIAKEQKLERISSEVIEAVIHSDRELRRRKNEQS